jgi:type III secretion protein C
VIALRLDGRDRSRPKGLVPVLRAACLALAVVLSSTAAAASRPPWPDAEFSYYADRSTLRRVLLDFAAGFNLTLESTISLTDVVNGRFNTTNPTVFIDRLAGTYGFTWFTYAGRLHVSSSRDVQVKPIFVPAVTSGSSLRQLLSSLGVLEPKFGWGELPEQGTVVISGPPAYVELVERTIRALPDGPSGMQVAVFKLRHASVQDRVVSYRDREITTPGVASILRNLVQGTAMSGSSQRTVAQPNLRATSESMLEGEAGRAGLPDRGAGLPGSAGGAGGPNAMAGGSAPPTGQRAQPGAPPGPNVVALPRFQPSIQAEPRTNSIIVQDTPDRIPVYERLIAQLDVPTQLVEIEAMIIDVNTNRLSELGVIWGTSFDGQRGALGMGNVADSAITANTLSVVGSSAAGAVPSAAVVSGADYFIARLRFLEQQGDASIQARPSILTSENLGAVIDLSETQYLQTVSERTALVTPITAGTTLRVTPRLVGTGDGQQVHLTLDIEDGQIQSASAGTRPSVRRGVVSTEASIRPDESLLIGGYNSVQTVQGEDKVPLLGDIPVLGALFRTRNEQLQRRERLFLIRSTVASRTSAMATRTVPELRFDQPLPRPGAGSGDPARSGSQPSAASPRAPGGAGQAPAQAPSAVPIQGTNLFQSNAPGASSAPSP